MNDKVVKSKGDYLENHHLMNWSFAFKIGEKKDFSAEISNFSFKKPQVEKNSSTKVKLQILINKMSSVNIFGYKNSFKIFQNWACDSKNSYWNI